MGKMVDDRIVEMVAQAKAVAVDNQLAGLGKDAALADQARIRGMLDVAEALGYDWLATDQAAARLAQARRRTPQPT